MAKWAFTVVLIVCQFCCLHNTSAHSHLRQSLTYLDTPPQIDGVLDTHALKLKPQPFPTFYDFGNVGPEPYEVSYRLGFTQHGLYLYVQTNASDLTYRGRGFVFGDGIKLIVGKPNRFGRSKEWKEFVYSPTPTTNSQYANRQYIQSVNMDGLARRLSDKSTMQEAVIDGGTGFEVFIH